jgi:hypothetical protein
MILKKRNEKKSPFYNVDFSIVPNIGSVFLCIKDVVMQSSGEIAYTKGKVYYSEKKGCITDNKGSINHGAPNDFLREYFKVKNK